MPSRHSIFPFSSSLKKVLACPKEEASFWSKPAVCSLNCGCYGMDGMVKSWFLRNDILCCLCWCFRAATDHNVDNTTAMLREWLKRAQHVYHYVEWRPMEEPRWEMCFKDIFYLHLLKSLVSFSQLLHPHWRSLPPLLVSGEESNSKWCVAKHHRHRTIVFL